jgi:hypothetical protein
MTLWQKLFKELEEPITDSSDTDSFFLLLMFYA